MMIRLFIVALLLMFDSRQLVSADWVEIPQFSDQHKVYRRPVKLQSQPQLVEKQQVYNSDNRRIHAGSTYFDHKIKFDIDTSLHNVSQFSESHEPFDPDSEIAGTIATFTTDRVVTSIIGESEDANDSELYEGINIESYDDDNHSQFDTPPTLYQHTSTSTSTTESPKKTTTDSSNHTNGTDNDKGFLDYLPIDLLKKVHKTLKSQPPTLRGKIRFLKAFERTLVSEIESRLSSALAPLRAPRGARDHDYHDDGIGFPSLEGTLMAISFLTFAVYLVRLVMMLFRNATMNTGTPPIFIGRKKRSVDDFSEETARILSYLETFPQLNIKH